MLLDVDSVLPMTVIGSFRPAAAAHVAGRAHDPERRSWDEKAARLLPHRGEQALRGPSSGSPGARDLSVMPYQEEPRDAADPVPVDVPPDVAARSFVPIVIAGSVTGRDEAKDDLRPAARHPLPALYERNVGALPRAARSRPLSVSTPDPRLDESFAWAKVGIDKGLATNPHARHGARRRLPHLGRERAPRLRLVLRPRRALDRARHPLLRRLRRGPHAPSTSCGSTSAPTARSPTRSRRARPSSPGSPTTRIPGTAPTPRRST